MIVTVSTVSPERTEYVNMDTSEKTLLSLPYSDDFEYADYPEDYLSSRGYAPRYTTDEGGAFEVEVSDSGNYLVQQITQDIRAKDWGWTPDPVTTLGDDRWYNYSVAVNVSFDPAEDKSANYVGAGLRYTLACNAYSGYWLRLYEDGNWKLKSDNTDRASGKIEGFDGSASHSLKIEAEGVVIRAYIDGAQVTEYDSSDALIGAGRAALYSSYNKNRFGDLTIEPVGDNTYITRYDNTDACFEYEGEWEHNTMSSFKNYKRTISKGKVDSVLTVSFDGTGFALTGETGGETVLSVSIDGGEAEIKGIYKTGSRGTSYLCSGLENTHHTAKITVAMGDYSVDGMEVIGGEVLLPEEEPVEEIPEETEASATDETTAENAGSKKISPAAVAGVAGGIAAAAAAAAAIAVTVKKKKK